MHKKKLFLCIVHFTGKLCICPVRHQDLLLLIDNFIYVLPFVSTSQLIIFPCSTIFFLIVNLHPKQLFLHKHLHPIDFRHAHISQLPDFVAIQQFHSSRAFIEVVAEREAAVPALDFTRARPEFEVCRFRRLEHTFERGDVYSVGH